MLSELQESRSGPERLLSAQIPPCVPRGIAVSAWLLRATVAHVRPGHNGREQSRLVGNGSPARFDDAHALVMWYGK
jgi:hypothetical protein